MRRVREMLRLRLGVDLTVQEVASRTGVARSTLREMMGRFERSGLIWPLALELTDAELELRLYGETGGRQGWRRKAKSLGAVQLLVLDDWGLEPLSPQARHDFLEILEDRYGRRSTLVTSQVPVADWHALIGHATYADAILDRLVHNAHRIDLAGDSMRRPKPTARA
jgi:hypothetical protein